MNKADMAIIGLAVMGQNLVLNAARKGYTVAVYNRTEAQTKEFIDRDGSKRIIPVYSLEELVDVLSRPRKVLLMVKAGNPVDSVCEQLFPLLDEGDLVIDGGNSHYADTNRRHAQAEERGLFYLGTSISGGEYGALHGPSIMVGGHVEGYNIVDGMLTNLSAPGPQGTCCAYLGPGCAGHYVKMVHNGIEYAIMEILAEAYDLMRRGLGMNTTDIAGVVRKWNEEELEGYLFEITEGILRSVDPDTERPLLDVILDTAKQKGTGKWSTQSALDLGSAAPTIAMAVFARIVSSVKEERITAESQLPGPDVRYTGDVRALLSDLFGAAYLATVAAYAQGFRQLQDASREQGYSLELAEVARVWMGGCIIRSGLLVPIANAFRDKPNLPLLFLAEPFTALWKEHHPSLRRVVITGHELGIAVPAMDSVLDFLDGYRTARLPANLVQAQRDYFGAHTYQRLDRKGAFHTEWEPA